MSVTVSTQNNEIIADNCVENEIQIEASGNLCARFLSKHNQVGNYDKQRENNVETHETIPLEKISGPVLKGCIKIHTGAEEFCRITNNNVSCGVPGCVTAGRS